MFSRRVEAVTVMLPTGVRPIGSKTLTSKHKNCQGVLRSSALLTKSGDCISMRFLFAYFRGILSAIEIYHPRTLVRGRDPGASL